MFNIFNKDDRESKQQSYGHYCNKCRQLDIEPVSYCDFSLDFWEIFRKNN